MAGALFLIPAAVLRNLADKLYEKRKNAALEVEGIVKQLSTAGDLDKTTAVINLLITEFTYSPQANHRKGGLISLAAATVALTAGASQHLEVVIGDFIVFFNPFLDALCKLSTDSDSNVKSAAHLLDQLVKY